ncbi:hypothetical protein Bbelb_243130 [Branchiostoma belcheri]|nr:hypothetical protein Bbelb_243130 [Branchiostoma belcheri]
MSTFDGYSTKDIYNMDESGQYYRAYTDKTLFQKGHDCSGWKRTKERVTIVYCATLLVTEVKTDSDRDRQNIDKKTLPVQYYNSKTACVTSYIFEDWVRKFDRKLGRDHRKAILFTSRRDVSRHRQNGRKKSLYPNCVQDDPVRYELRHLKEVCLDPAIHLYPIKIHQPLSSPVKAAKRAKHKRTRAFQFANEFFMENTTYKGMGREVWQMMQTREERRFAEEAEQAAATLRGASEPPVRPLQYPTWDHAPQPPPSPWGGRPSRGRSPPRGRHSHNAAP